MVKTISRIYHAEINFIVVAEEIVLIHHAQIKTDGMAQWKIKIDHATT